MFNGLIASVLPLYTLPLGSHSKFTKPLAIMKCRPKICMLDPYHQDAISLLQSYDEFETILLIDVRITNWQADADALLSAQKYDFNYRTSVRL
jgi:hypothetical protein